MISLMKIFWYLVRKQRYTILYFFMKKVLGPRLLHPCYSKPPLYNRLLTFVTTTGTDYFYDPWVVV